MFQKKPEEGAPYEDYERRLQNMPRLDKEVEKQIKQLEQQVAEQNQEIQLHDLKIEALKSDLNQLTKQIETKQTQLQQLNETQQKSTAKQKKYMLQIDTLTKKIELLKQDIQKKTKDIESTKKELKTRQANLNLINTEKSKTLQALTKKQIKMNQLTQNITELKLKKVQPQQSNNGRQTRLEDNKKDEKQLVDLFNAVKKQFALIDVLKRQKMHLIASTVFKYCQDDFNKVLEMGKKNAS